ncbi:MAG TPA: TIGR03016 family PEP-CTERM system-associated outer membrane protein [Telluria sp.]
MAKPSRRAALALAPLALLVSQAAGAAWKFAPEIEAKEIFTDNARRTVSSRNESAWITEITPGLKVSNYGPRIRFDALYQLHYFIGPSDANGDNTRSYSELAARLSAALVDDWLYFDGSASISQQAVSAFGPRVTRAYGNENAAEVRTWRASPYLRHRFGNTATAELRYEVDSVETGRSGLGNSDGQTASVRINSGRRFGDLGWNVFARERRIDDELTPETSEANALFGLRYSIGRTFALTGDVGYDKYDYGALGGVNEGRSWSAGMIWTPGVRTRIEANAGRHFYGDSYFLSANHRTRATAWSVNYSDSVTNTRSQFLLPSTVDTASMLDSLFLSAFPDPEERRQAVDAYIRATGLPPTLADSINYFSNRYFLQKQFRAAVVLRGARSRMVLSAHAMKRDALSSAVADSALLGPSLLNLNDNTKQHGASALWSYRLNSGMDLNTGLEANRTESLTTGRVGNHTTARVALNRQFDRRLSGMVEVRRETGPASAFTGKYTENSVSAAVTMRY